VIVGCLTTLLPSEVGKFPILLKPQRLSPLDGAVLLRLLESLPAAFMKAFHAGVEDRLCLARLATPSLSAAVTSASTIMSQVAPSLAECIHGGQAHKTHVARVIFGFIMISLAAVIN
jgi:hypothetical protein